MILFDEFLRYLSQATPGLEVPDELAMGWAQWGSGFPLDCPKFDLRGIDLYDADVVDFGRKLCTAQVLGFPAPAFYFQWVNKSVVVAENGAAYRSRKAKDNDEDAIIATFGLFVYMIVSEASAYAKLVRCIQKNGQTFACLPVGIDLRGDTCAAILNGTFQQPHAGDLVLYVDELLAFLSVLTIKQATQTVIRPSARVQAKRERRGERPLPEYVTIHLTPDAVSSASDASGFRNSPRPHFRRGHIRFVNRGTDREMIVPVAPSWVNAAGVPLPNIRPYQVKK